MSYAGKLTADGNTWLGELLQNALSGAAISQNYGYMEIGTGAKGNLAAGTALQLNSNVAKGATSVVLKDSGGVLAGSLVAGDFLLFSNDNTRYEVASAATASGNLITVPLANALVAAKTAGDGVTTNLGGSSGSTGVRTSISAGGGVAITTGWPKVVDVSTGKALEVKATFVAGTFTVGTPFTEAAIRASAGGGKCAAYAVLETNPNPPASQSLDVTIQLPLVGII